MTDYQKGHIKRNPQTGEVALRTMFPADRTPRLAAMAWLVATPNVGARNCHTDEVEDWDDVFVPAVEPPSEEPDMETPAPVGVVSSEPVSE